MKRAVLKWIEKWIKKPHQILFKLVRIFQENLGFIGMGLFISTMHRDLETKLLFLTLYDKLIKAYIAFLGLPLIIARKFDEITQNQYLFNYFMQYPLFEEYVNHIKYTPQPTLKTEIDEELLTSLINATPFNELLEKIDWFKDYAYELFKSIAVLINSIIELEQANTTEVVEYINQHFNINSYTLNDCLISPDLVLVLNPLFDLHFAVLATSILVYSSYESIFLTEYLTTQPRRFYHYGTSKVQVRAKEEQFKTIMQFFQPKTDLMLLKINIETINKLMKFGQAEVQFWHEGVTSNIILLEHNLRVIEDWEIYFIHSPVNLQFTEDWES